MIWPCKATGVPVGPIVSRITIEVDVVGSNLHKGLLRIDRPKARERELAKKSIQIDEHKKLKSGNAEPYARQK